MKSSLLSIFLMKIFRMWTSLSMISPKMFFPMKKMFFPTRKMSFLMRKMSAMKLILKMSASYCYMKTGCCQRLTLRHFLNVNGRSENYSEPYPVFLFVKFLVI